jgi:hypothetical protein
MYPKDTFKTHNAWQVSSILLISQEKHLENKEFALYFRLSKALHFGFPKIVPTLGLPHSGPCSFKHRAFGLYPTQNASISMVFHHLMAFILFQN